MKDYYSDYGHNFIKIFSKVEMPDFLKEAEILTEDKIASLNDIAFADPIKRKFPICTAADTYVSAAYAEYSGADSLTKSEIYKAAKAFGIDEEVESLKRELSSIEKVAEAAEFWRVDFEKDGVKLFAEGASSEDLHQAYENFSKKAYDLIPSYTDRKEVAVKFCEVFDKLGEEIPFSLGAMAERNFPNYVTVVGEIKSRALRLDDHSKKASLIKLADSIEQIEERDVDSFSKLAQVLEEIDKMENLKRFYGRGISNPSESVFNTVPESVFGDIQVIKLGSLEFSAQELKEVAFDMFKQALDEEDFMKVAQNNEIDVFKLNEVSENSKKRLEQYLSA
jgi:uncharacterized protein